jgi:hypothetical protein
VTLQTATPKSYRLARFFLRGRAWGWYLARLHKTEKRWNRPISEPAPKVYPADTPLGNPPAMARGTYGQPTRAEAKQWDEDARAWKRRNEERAGIKSISNGDYKIEYDPASIKVRHGEEALEEPADVLEYELVQKMSEPVVNRETTSSILLPLVERGHVMPQVLLDQIAREQRDAGY